MLGTIKKVKFVATAAPRNTNAEEKKSETVDLNAELEREMLVIGNVFASKHGTLVTESSQNNQTIANCCQRIKALIEAGANPNHKGFDDFTPLLLAAFVGDLGLLKFLLKHPSVDLDALNHEGQSVLHCAVVNNQILQVLLVLQAFSSDRTKLAERINKQNEGGYVALEYAVRDKIDPNILKILLLEGADPQPILAQLSQVKATPQNDPEDTIKMILRLANKAGSPTDLVKRYLNKILEVIREMYSWEELEPLEKEAFEGLIEDVMSDFLQLATDEIKASEIMYKVLYVSQGVTVLVLQNQGSRSLQESVKDLESLKYYLELITRLVEKGANPNLQIRNNGTTALHLAVYLNLPDICERLIVCGASSEIKDFAGKKPYDLQAIGVSISPSQLSKTKTQAKAASKTKAEEIFVEKTPEERVQELQKLMLSLQAFAENVRAFGKENEIKKMLFLLEKSSADINILTKKNYAALHLAARFGNAADVENLLAKNANINLKTIEGKSVLNCAIISKNNDVVRSVLQAVDLEFATILEETKDAIASKNQALVSLILNDESVVKKFLNLEESERKSCGEELRVAANKITKHANFKSIKASVEALLRSHQLELEIDETQDLKLSKNQRKKNREAEKKIKKQQEELEARNKKNLFEVRAEARKIAAETIENVATEFSQIEQNFIVNLKSDVLEENSKEQLCVNLSPNAEEFLPPKEQIKKFLLGARQINSVQDLPKFLQPSLIEFLQNGCEVALKGSAVYLAPTAKKAPSDLDVEVTINGMGKWSDEVIAKFVFEKLGLRILPENIFRKDGVFTLNFKDHEKKLDFSFYDSEMLPPERLSWATNCETKIFFDSSGVAFRNEMSSQLRVNPQAHGLILRLCFLETIGHLEKNEIALALVSIAPVSPIDLLAKELKLDRVGVKKSPQEIIFGYMQSHSLDENEQKHFLSNLSWMLEISNSRTSFFYENLSATVCEMKKIFERNEPQKTTTPIAQGVQRLSQNLHSSKLSNMV